MSELNQFDDLTNYSHMIAPFRLKGVINVGWLKLESSIPLGGVAVETLRKLKEIVTGNGIFNAIVEPIRESPCCPICGELDLRDAKGRYLANSELWIPAGEVIYASPISILHYIEVHNYRPPQEYIEAIEALDMYDMFIAHDVYLEKLEESGWVGGAG
jgi:hypothetical protein